MVQTIFLTNSCILFPVFLKSFLYFRPISITRIFHSFLSAFAPYKQPFSAYKYKILLFLHYKLKNMRKLAESLASYEIAIALDY